MYRIRRFSYWLHGGCKEPRYYFHMLWQFYNSHRPCGKGSGEPYWIYYADLYDTWHISRVDDLQDTRLLLLKYCCCAVCGSLEGRREAATRCIAEVIYQHHLCRFTLELLEQVGNTQPVLKRNAGKGSPNILYLLAVHLVAWT